MTKSGLRKKHRKADESMSAKIARQKNAELKQAAGSEDEQKMLLISKMGDIKKLVNNLKYTANVYKKTFEGVCGEFNCRQFQMIGQDLASILMHIDDIETNGPDDAHEDIPLEKSEIPLEEATPGFNPEIVEDKE